MRCSVSRSPGIRGESAWCSRTGRLHCGHALVRKARSAQVGDHRRVVLRLGLLAADRHSAAPAPSGLVSGGGGALGQCRSLGIRICVAHTVHTTSGVHFEGGCLAIRFGDHSGLGDSVVLALCDRSLAAGQKPGRLPHYDGAMAGDDPLQPRPQATLRGLLAFRVAHTVVWEERARLHTHGRLWPHCCNHS